MEPRDNTVQSQEIDFDIKEYCLFSKLCLSRLPVKSVLEENDDWIKSKTEEIEDPTIREFYMINYLGELDDMMKFISRFSNDEVKRTLCREVLLGECNRREIFLYRKESLDKKKEFWNYSLSNCQGIFQKMEFLQIMKNHTEMISLPVDPDTDEYLEFERFECNSDLESIGKTLEDGSTEISYIGFYYPNQVIDRKNINKSRLMKDLKDGRKSFTQKELEDIEKAVRVTAAIDGDGLSFKEFNILKEVLRRQSLLENIW